MKTGQRVIITAMPWKGRRGIVAGKTRIAWVIPAYTVWCDNPDMMGRRMVRLRRSEMEVER